MKKEGARGKVEEFKTRKEEKYEKQKTKRNRQEVRGSVRMRVRKRS